MALFGKTRGNPPAIAGEVRAHVELAFAPERDRSLLLIGWVHDPLESVSAWTLASASGQARVLEDGRDGVRLLRLERADVSAQHGPGAGGREQHGFVLFVPDAGGGSRLRFECHARAPLDLAIEAATDPDEILAALRLRWDQAGQAVSAISRHWRADAWLSRGLRELFEGRLWQEHEQVPTWLEEPRVFHGSIDRVWALGELGLVVLGWFVSTPTTPRAITILTPDGGEIEIADRMVRVYRADVLGGVEAQAQRSDMLGFICLAPLPTARDDQRMVRFDLGAAGTRILRIPTDRPLVPGVALAQEILASIPSADRLRGSLHAILDGGFGTLIDALVAAEPRARPAVRERQFGTPPANPPVSVVVPLFGRFDFLRHQLAHFADDADFADIDLIYVIDDPKITAQATEYAAHYHPVFARPFRLLSYGCNLGFAGANNVGVAHARAATVVLLNSDVIPQRAGWVGALARALDELPGAGAVAPLLEFGDGGVQHAGMRARHDPTLPGFLMNWHPGKGQPWRGGAEPLEQVLLTGACLCLRRAEYAASGGFDEGYLVGDFEDSDLCLTLRSRGLRLWLLPAVRLWHLERQSQVLDRLDGARALITLYNAWRYECKIRTGQLPDPVGEGG